MVLLLQLWVSHPRHSPGPRGQGATEGDVMPTRARSFCVVPGCSTLVDRGRCPPHALAQEQTRTNTPIRRWYRTPRWKALRARVLVDQAYQCARCHQVRPALDIDHILPHGGNPDLFWDRLNLQALCGACHGRKTRAGV